MLHKYVYQNTYQLQIRIKLNMVISVVKLLRTPPPPPPSFSGHATAQIIIIICMVCSTCFNGEMFYNHESTSKGFLFWESNIHYRYFLEIT